MDLWIYVFSSNNAIIWLEIQCTSHVDYCNVAFFCPFEAWQKTLRCFTDLAAAHYYYSIITYNGIAIALVQ